MQRIQQNLRDPLCMQKRRIHTIISLLLGYGYTQIISRDFGQVLLALCFSKVSYIVTEFLLRKAEILLLQILIRYQHLKLCNNDL